MSKGILKRQESPPSNTSTPDSTNKHVKWDEEKLRESEAVKQTIVKGQIDEPKTPFHQGDYGTSIDESESECGGGFNLRRNSDQSESESMRSSSCSSSEGEGSHNFSGWESSYSEMETDDTDSEASQARKHEKFMAMRAQHYFMKSAIQEAKDLIDSENEQEEQE